MTPLGQGKNVTVSSYHCKQRHFTNRYRAGHNGWYVVWWILFLLLLTSSASTCLQHSRNLGPAIKDRAQVSCSRVKGLLYPRYCNPVPGFEEQVLCRARAQPIKSGLWSDNVVYIWTCTGFCPQGCCNVWVDGQESRGNTRLHETWALSLVRIVSGIRLCTANSF